MLRVVGARAVVACVVLGLAGTGGAGRAATLEGRMKELLGSPLVKGALVSMDVVEVKGNGGSVELFGHNATMPLGPASNCKILTTAAALEKYGARASFKTYLYKVGEDLVVVGGGDPGLGDPKIAEAKGEKITTAFERWAEVLKRAGVVQFRDLVIDDRVFDAERVNPNWPAHDAGEWFCAPIGGLNFNDNCDAKGAPVKDPGMFAGGVLRDVLKGAGIRQTGGVRRVEPQEQVGAGVLVASAETPLMEVIGRANKNSLNMMAECLCKRLGHDAASGSGGGIQGSWENGTASVMAYVTGLGADPSWVTLDDGSGLSNKNRVAARAFTMVLAHVAGAGIEGGHGENADVGNLFVDSLAIPGEDGTLKHRFRGMSVAKAIHAKTGHISGVSTLSGYIDASTKEGKTRRIAFSILCNKYQGNVNPWQDQVCQAIYQWAVGK
ncbi:MAG TPA: D-alanyl-D-alanine carboxypeptidase/D-alanyl-D-alanine-endopeptidase [Phycisphaerae bacterium]|nr:D-alanyl-D-alanine carboxypeptidase/D-alanyl-D-alanine-endopeptidase [Phycisphaerae bacterium]